MITCNEMDLIHLTPDGQAWDTHDESYAYYEDIFLYFNEDLRNPPPAKKQQLIEEVENRFFLVKGGRYEAAVDAIFAARYVHFISETEYQPQSAYDDSFNIQDEQMQAQISDLSACFDSDLFCDALNSHRKVSKFVMASGCTNI